MNKEPHKPYRKMLRGSQEAINVGVKQIREIIRHSAEKGSLIENTIRTELEKILPYKVGVGDGFVVDSDGQTSRQMDIILYDKLNTPRIFASPGLQVFPVESTYACGEIKTSLTKDELKNTFDKCESYKSLERKAYIKNEKGAVANVAFGEGCDHWESVFFCIAVDGVSLEKLDEMYEEIIKKRSLENKYKKRVDCICILDGKLLAYSTIKALSESGIPEEGSVYLTPRSKDSVHCVFPARESWSAFVFLLLNYMLGVDSPRVDIFKYDDGSLFGEASDQSAP